METFDSSDTEMGPGVDLVMSLLALILLVLAIVAIEQKASRLSEERIRAELGEVGMERTNLESALVDARLTLAEREIELQEALNQLEQKDFFIATVETSRDEARDLAASVQAQLDAMSLEDPNEISADGSLQVALLEAELAVLSNENEALSDHLHQIRDEYAATVSRIGALERQVQRTQELLDAANEKLAVNERRIEIELSDTGDLRIFDQGQATLTEDGRQSLYRLIPRLTLAVENGQPNVLRIAGHASAERMVRGIRQGFDNNLQLSAERSLTIAYELASLGVPMRCIAIEGHGRARSPTLGRFVHSDIGSEAFDRIYRQLPNQRRQRLTRDFVAERRVEILVTTEDEGQCSWELLSSGVHSAGREAARLLVER